MEKGNGTFKIEKGVPIPKRQSSRLGKSKYPYQAMNVGDSILLPHFTRTSQLGGTLDVWKRATGWAFESRSVKGGVRVWRTR